MPTSTPSPVFGNQEFHYTREDFQQVRERLYRLTGISLAESKAQLVYSRLSRACACCGSGASPNISPTSTASRASSSCSSTR